MEAITFFSVILSNIALCKLIKSFNNIIELKKVFHKKKKKKKNLNNNNNIYI